MGYAEPITTNVNKNFDYSFSLMANSPTNLLIVLLVQTSQMNI
jgi:hypothetical protein